jgi:hypothetical protein
MCPQTSFRACRGVRPAYGCTVPHRRKASRAQRVGGGMRHSSAKSSDNGTALSTGPPKTYEHRSQRAAWRRWASSKERIQGRSEVWVLVMGTTI